MADKSDTEVYSDDDYNSNEETEYDEELEDIEFEDEGELAGELAIDKDCLYNKIL
jgi:hypothetical protein